MRRDACIRGTKPNSVWSFRLPYKMPLHWRNSCEIRTIGPPSDEPVLISDLGGLHRHDSRAPAVLFVKLFCVLLFMFSPHCLAWDLHDAGILRTSPLRLLSSGFEPRGACAPHRDLKPTIRDLSSFGHLRLARRRASKAELHDLVPRQQHAREPGPSLGVTT